MSGLFQEALRHYKERVTAPVNEDLIAALRTVQQDAGRAG
jgi:hypothetical protein